MQTAEQQSGAEAVASGQRIQMSSSRLIFIGAMVITVLYVVWGIARIIL